MIGALLRNRYELVALVAEGPIFSLYMAKDSTAGREVSIRLFRSPFDREPEFVEAVGMACRKAASVNHPGVERIEGVEFDGGRPFLVGQYSPGITLAERIRKLAPFSVPVAVGTAISILEGLEALHAAGVVHGDVNSDNVVIGLDGSAKLQLSSVWEAYSRSATAGAVVLPSLAPFLAPEVSAGGVPTFSSDVYSVGIILFELLCGRPPYAADSPLAMAIKHATAPTPSVKGFNASAPVVLDEIVKRSMSKAPNTRYMDAGSMLSDLRMLQDALRFGRTLTWPIRKSEASEAAEPVQVAPKMSAARMREKREGKRKPVSEEHDDVPRWLNYVALALITVVGTIILMWAFMNGSKPKLVKVPSLKGIDVTQARNTLRAMHLELRQGQHVPNEQYAAETVLSSDPDAEEQVREGSTVIVTVSSGSKLVEVPNVVGMEVDSAISALQRLDLNVEQPVDTIDSDAPRDQVVEEDPPANRKIAHGASVKLKVSDGNAPADGARTNTNETGNDSNQKPSDYTLHIKLTDTDVAVDVRVEIEDARDTRTVHEQTHDPGEEFTVEAQGYGPDATFRIYYDGELKKTIHEPAPKQATRRARV